MKNYLNKNIQITYEQTTGIMDVAIEGFIPYERMIDILQYKLNMIQFYSIKSCLIDLRKIRVYAPGIPEYMSMVWYSQAKQEGVNKIAFIVPTDVVALMSMNKANAQFKNTPSFEIKYFSDKKPAMDWILMPVENL